MKEVIRQRCYGETMTNIYYSKIDIYIFDSEPRAKLVPRRQVPFWPEAGAGNTSIIQATCVLSSKSFLRLAVCVSVGTSAIDPGCVKTPGHIYFSSGFAAGA
jgi:hypothetical protein